jgi:hypothetical protein
MTLSPEQYEKRMDEATVKVPRPESRKVWPTQPMLARALEAKLKETRRGLEELKP